MQALIDNKYMTVKNEDWILFLIWKDSTSFFDDELFKESALKFHSVVNKLKSKKILVDMRKFSFILTPEIINWRKENIITLYNKIKVEKFAFISDKPSVKQDDPNNTFITCEFKSEIDAINWLR